MWLPNSRDGAPGAWKGLGGQRRQQRVDLGGLVLGADVLERLCRLAPGQPRISGVAERARRLTKLAQQLGLQQPVLEPLGLEDPDSESRDALLERAPLALDAGPAL